MIIRAASTEDRARLLAYLSEKLRELPHDLVGDMPFEIIATAKGSCITGAVLYLNFRRQSIEMHCAGEPGWLTRPHLRELFGYPFEQLGCLRVWGVAHRKNKKARHLNERLGFKVTGVLDDEFGVGQDGILYSMKRSQCRWID